MAIQAYSRAEARKTDAGPAQVHEPCIIIGINKQEKKSTWPQLDYQKKFLRNKISPKKVIYVIAPSFFTAGELFIYPPIRS